MCQTQVDVEDSVPRVVPPAEDLPSPDDGSDEELFAWASASTEDDGVQDQFVIQNNEEEPNEEVNFWGDESGWAVESLESSGVRVTIVDEDTAEQGRSKRSGAKRRSEDAIPSSRRWRHRQRAAVLEEELASFLPHSTARRLSRAFTRDIDLDTGSYTPPPSSGRGVHRSGLRILSGTRGGLRLLAPQDAATRPMMARVRGAAFDMVLSLAGGAPDTLPPASHWLDLYAGTGAVGIEALSRGAERAEFVEADPWTARNVLGPNLHAARADLGTDAVVHVTRAEDFLAGLARRALTHNDPTTPFDFVSVCPPYESVDYTEVFGLLEKAGALHEVRKTTCGYCCIARCPTGTTRLQVLFMYSDSS